MRRTLLDRLHFVSTPDVVHETENELVLQSRRKPVWNPVFLIGTVLFASSMFLKANVDEKWAAIPLAISALILLAGVWLLSAHGQVIFNGNELKIYRIYKHLGYVQKIYITPLESVDSAVVFERKNAGVHLHLDNMGLIFICKMPAVQGDANDLVERINKFLERVI